MADRESTQVYITYSRKDKEFAQRLVESLKRSDITVWIDYEQLVSTENWMTGIEQGIQNSEAYIFILSPDSLKSTAANQELKLATNANKRVIPIVARDVDYKEVPIELSSLNWIFMRSQDDFESSYSKIVEAIYTDLEWVKEHKRLQILALDWEKNGKDSSYLLRGHNYQNAMQAVTVNNRKEPYLTSIQQEFLLASQQSRGLFDRFDFRSANQTSKAQSNAEPIEQQAGTQDAEDIQPIEVGKLFSVSTDQSSGADQLNYARFADAFVTLIKNPEAKTPITIGIYGQWGSGKSFLMKKIKEALSNDPNANLSWFGNLITSIRRLFSPKTEQVDTVIIEFNAWVYSGSEHLWASLFTHLYREVEKYIGIRTHFYRLWKAVRRLFPKAVGVFLFYAIPALIISLLTDFANIQSTWEAMNTAGQAVSVSVVGGSLLATLPILWSALREFGDTLFMSQAANLQKLASKPDFRDQIGIMADIKAEIGFITQLLESRNRNRQTRVVLFIDDLDRCEHRKAVEVLQAVMLLLADRDGSPFVVFLGIDARVIVRAIEENYGSVLVKAGINGYEYLDKIVQMPFVIPFANRRDIGNYIDSLIWSKEEKEQVEAKFAVNKEMDPDSDERIPDIKKEETPTEQRSPASTPVEKPVSQIRTEAVPVTFTKPEREALKRCVDDIIENPRKIKRIVNIYRFVRLLFPSNFQEHEKIIRWILLTEQWPLHTAWILEEIESDYDLKGELSKNQNATILDVYKRIKTNLYSDEMDELMTIDADPIAFHQFIQKQPIFTVQEIYYLLYPLTFNLNPAVRSEITKYKARIAESYIKDQDQPQN
ncbi:MAG: P-loop NTPase fold protein [Anaerolineae bacterium]